MAEAGSKRRPSEVRCFRNWGLHVDVEDSRSEDSYEFGKGNRCLDHQRMRGNSSRWVDDSKKG